jgi:hypothetical protein
MRASELDLLFAPDLTGAASDHWQARWAAKALHRAIHRVRPRRRGLRRLGRGGRAIGVERGPSDRLHRPFRRRARGLARGLAPREPRRARRLSRRASLRRCIAHYGRGALARDAACAIALAEPAGRQPHRPMGVSGTFARARGGLGLHVGRCGRSRAHRRRERPWSLARWAAAAGGVFEAAMRSASGALRFAYFEFRNACHCSGVP